MDSFERVAPLIRASLEHEHHTETLEEVRQEIVSGRAQMWVGQRCVVVTRLDKSDCLAVVLWIVGGDLKELVQLLPGIEAFARTWGATQACFIPSRPGWGRLMRTAGFAPVGDGVVGKDL